MPMAGISSISSLVANITTADFGITVGQATASSGTSATTPPSGPVSIDFYQSTTETEAAEILKGGTGWSPLAGSFDETASLAVVTSAAGVSDIGTYADRSDGGIIFGGAAWGGDQAAPAGLTPTFQIELERDSPDTVSATITAADGTVSTIEINDPASAPAAAAITPAASSPENTPAAPITAVAPAATTAPVQSAPAAPAAFKLPAGILAAFAATATATATDGDSALSLTFDAWGDFAATFAATNNGAVSAIEATQW
jgi:hypothetical protein